MDYKEKYEQLIKMLREADDDGLFDEKTSRLASIPFKHRMAFRRVLLEDENLNSVS